MTGGTTPLSRNRWWYFAAMITVLFAGLLWRSHFLPLPKFAGKYGGDALWSLLVFYGFAFLWPRLSTLRLALIVLAFSWAVEFSQIYHAPWIDSIRSTRLGNLILGSTFNGPDLVAYAVGVGLGFGMERFLSKSSPAPKLCRAGNQQF